MRKLYVGQKPATPLVLNVSDTQGQPLVLSEWTAYQVLIKSPTGAMINDVTANVTINGSKAIYTWGTNSIFTEPGDWHFQLKLAKSGQVADYSSIVTIEVLPSLETP
jgi:hypothetical protein